MQKIYRLTQRASFNYIYRNGIKAYSKNFTLYYVKAYNLKFGISVNKKVGNSVARNKVKRRIKESLREIIPMITPQYNFVVVAREGISDASFIELKQELIKTIQKERLFALSDAS